MKKKVDAEEVGRVVGTKNGNVVYLDLDSKKMGLIPEVEIKEVIIKGKIINSKKKENIELSMNKKVFFEWIEKRTKERKNK